MNQLVYLKLVWRNHKETPLHTTRMVTMKAMENNKRWQGYRETGTLVHGQRNCPVARAAAVENGLVVSQNVKYRVAT